MLRIYEVALDVVGDLTPVIEEIQRRNRNLADQLDRAVTAVPLAIAEGTSAIGRNRHAAYQRAINELRESGACCDVAVRRRYIKPLAAPTTSKMSHVIGALVKIVR